MDPILPMDPILHLRCGAALYIYVSKGMAASYDVGFLLHGKSGFSEAPICDGRFVARYYEEGLAKTSQF